MRMDYKTDPSGGPFQAMLNTAYGGLTATGRNFEPWFRAAARGNLETFTLMSRRAQAYMELPMRLSQCRTPQDLVNEQMYFWQTMTRQYADSSQRIAAAWLDVAQKAGRRDRNGREKERDYITFPEPEEAAAAAGSGSSAERRAA